MELQKLRQYAKSNKVFSDGTTFDQLLGQALDAGITQGLEYEVYYQNGRWYKRHALNYMTFGLIDYFQRLTLTNRLNSGQLN